MREYIIKKLAIAVLVLLGVYTIVFALTFMAPGDPARVSMGQFSNPETLAIIRAKWGLDQPFYVQYYKYGISFLKGDLGMSYRYDRPVIDILVPRIKVTFYYGLWAILFAILLSIPLGIIAAYKQNSIIDNISILISQTGVCIPNFWLGMMLIAIVSVRLGWIDPVPEVTPSVLWSFSGFFTSIKPYLLAIITLGTGMMATMTRMTRSSMLEVIREDYITLARSKGLSEKAIILKHAFRNALIPVITIIGFSFLLLVGGAVLTETVFGINGLGRIYVTSIQFRDYPVITATTLLYGFGVVIINLIVDLIYGWIDPRVSLR